MLKISYSDTDIAIEQLAATTEAVVVQRSILALRVGQSIFVQAGCGSVLLPAAMSGMAAFLTNAKGHARLTAAPCDYAWIEVTLRGIWIAQAATSEQGVLAVELGEALEQQLTHLWRRSLNWAAEEQPLPRAC